MNTLTRQLQALFGARAPVIRALGVPAFVILVLAMMVLPLPPFALDLLFTFNSALALMVVMISSQMVKPLDFAAFPTVLLITTLLRLSLNVASTRVVLVDGHTGPAAAGKVIESFGHFLIGGNFAVGLIVFSILVVVVFATQGILMTALSPILVAGLLLAVLVYMGLLDLAKVRLFQHLEL